MAKTGRSKRPLEFKAATQGGAQLLNLSDLGSLKPGFKADLIAVKLPSITYDKHPENFWTSLIQETDGTKVKAVWIGGELVEGSDGE